MKISNLKKQPVAFILAVEWARCLTGMGGGGGFTRPTRSQGSRPSKNRA